MSPIDLERLETLSDTEWIEVLLWMIAELLRRLAAINNRLHLS